MLTPLRKSLREMFRLMHNEESFVGFTATESRSWFMMFLSADGGVRRENALAGQDAAASQIEIFAMTLRWVEIPIHESKWCERGDSNPHGFTRQILSLVRLPIPPLSQFVFNHLHFHPVVL
jgi:hypothetical protein